MSNFVAQQVSRTHGIRVPAPVDRAFPLFEPLGEKHWAYGWSPDMLYPASGEASVGTVFTTQQAGEPAKIWTIIAYEKEQAHVTYVNVLPHAYTSRIDVRCEPDGPQATSVCVTYTLTALTPHGNEYIEQFTEEHHYQAYISSWETAIRHYLLHGHILPHPEE
ncbi:MAG: SRPBCC family protein [Ktedonobacteraceae bacterium]|nr:SRPBCC family protein [Ktedonobacteraceae bacterium]